MSLHPLAKPHNGRKPKILLEIKEGYDGLFMLDERYEHSPGQAHPVNESPDPSFVYQKALIRVDQLKRMGFDVALDVKSRLF